MKLISTLTEQAHKRNAKLLIFDGIVYSAGFAMMLPATILPGFLSLYTSNPILINALPGIAAFGLFAPQILSSWLYENSVSRNKTFVIWSYITRFGLLPLPFIAFFATGLKEWVVPLFFLSVTAGMVAWGMNNPLWLDLISRIVTQTKRAKILSLRGFLCQIAAFGGGALALKILSYEDYLYRYALVFGISMAFMWIGNTAYHFVHEAVESMNPSKRLPLGKFVKIVGNNLKEYPGFTALIIAFALGTGIQLCNGILTVDAINSQSLTSFTQERDKYVALLGLTFTLSTAIGALVGGYVVQKFGDIPALALGWMCYALAAGNALIAGSKEVFLFSFVVHGMAAGIEAVAAIDILIALTPSVGRIRFIAMANTCKGIVAGIFGMSGGFLAAQFGKSTAFIVSFGCCALSAIIIITYVRAKYSKFLKGQVAEIEPVTQVKTVETVVN